MITSGISIIPLPEPGAAVERLLGAWPHHPYRACPGVDAEARTRYALDSIRASRERGATTLVALTDQGLCGGLIQMESLPWDSAMLGFSVARVGWWIPVGHDGQSTDLQEHLLLAAVEEARRRGASYLVARTAAGDSIGIHLLQKHQFQMVDGLLTFGRIPGPTTASQTEDSVRCDLFQPPDLEEVERVAASSFRYDRFHMDPAVGAERADHLHRMWARNSCAGFADAVLVARKNGAVAGFTTLKLDAAAERILGAKVGIIVLVATATAFRGQGVGRTLAHAALEWFARQGCQWAEVGTQVANVVAGRLYQSAGFELVAASVTFRRLF